MKFALLFVILSFSSGTWAEECLECHTDKLDKPVQHEAAKMDCTICHAGHESGEDNTPPTESKKINALCFQCHDSQGLKGSIHTDKGFLEPGHPVVKHPVEGKKDPVHPERQFSCVSCHNPHSSRMPKLIRYDYTKTTPYKGLFCAVCHWNYAFPLPAPPPPPWEMPLTHWGR